MSSSLPTITLRPISGPEDFLTLARVESDAFYNDPFSIVAFGPLRASEENLALRAKGLAKTLNDTKDDKGREKQWKYIQAVKKMGDCQGDGEEVVGWACWCFVTGKGGATEQGNGIEKEKEVKAGTAIKSEKEKPEPNPWGVSANAKFCEDVYLPSDQWMLDSCGGNEYVKLSALIVAPEYQRKGIGTMLLEAGLKEADAGALQCVLGASPEGEGLYRRYGFKQVMNMDLKLWEYEGGEGLGTTTHGVMHRPAKNV
ncbi:uncharacterized protein BP5553_05025 [Venustampulla echinocandica]|uniref:N-acetyltransferase domain-containing protein n=1 Tax=Venustampulla echinocandica TaxID=2656787 RepID=A0A370TQ13_9HELO|nr:uncharacterized protein BP5553_05025 [Venustampulla echinocandica]RDL37592.1 hypothetical protein BP5553_05025 [Venustampulla echinocandica]